MRQYRYRTAALTGPWRDTYDEALADAARAKQVSTSGADEAEVRWIVPGRIEDRATVERPTRLRS